MAAGDFSPSALPTILAKVSEKWMDPALNSDYVARVEGIKAIQNEQRVNLGEFKVKNKLNVVEVAWLKGCDITDQACSDDCTNTGTELESAVQEHALTLCRESKFTVLQKGFRTNLFDPADAIAMGLLRAMKSLDEYWNKMVYTKLNTFAGVNAFDSTLWTLGNVPQGIETEVPAASLTVALVPELNLAAYANFMSNPFLLSGSTLYTQIWTAMMNGVNPEGQGTARMWDGIRKYFDLQWADSQNSPDKLFYLIDQGAVAYVNKAWYETPQSTKFDERFTMASKNIPGLLYDVIYTQTCSSNDIVHGYTVQTLGDIFLNPVPCEATRTGVYVFKALASGQDS